MTRPLVRLALAAAVALLLSATATAQPKLRTLTEQELVDIVVGSSILCTRGGDTAGLVTRVKDAVAQGLHFRLVALEDVPDDWLAFTAFGVGGGGAWEHVIDRMEKAGFVRGRPADPRAPTAVDVLAEYMGRKFDVTFEAEAGGATVSALITAARRNIPLVDGCPSGRCLPEVQMSPFFMNGITRAPLAAVTRYGDTIIIPRVHDDYRVEDLTRALAVASGGGVTLAANAVSGKVLKQNLIPGFLTRALALGRAAREAKAAGRDPVQSVVEAGGGYLLFRGVVKTSESKGDRGFGWTDATLQGTGAFAGSVYRVFVKNENMIAWRDGQLDAAAPDLISPLDPATGWAMRGGAVIGSYTVGQPIAMVGFPNHPIWRTAKGIEMLGPRHFGFDEDYVPIDQLQKRRRTSPP